VARDVQEDTIETVEGLIEDLRDDLVAPDDVEPLENRVSELDVEMTTGMKDMEARIAELEGCVADVEKKQKSGWLRR